MKDREEPAWLSRILVRAIHADQVREHGGIPGLRDEGLLESALERARNRWAYDASADLADLAAAYGHGLAGNHPFMDGNKRVAFQAMYVFAGLNGRRLQASEPEVVELMTAAAAGSVGLEELASWVREHLEPR